MFAHETTPLNSVKEHQYCEDLITEDNIRDLLDTRPWEELENPKVAISFETDVGGRLGVFVSAYLEVEKKYLQAYWESTHNFPISAAKRQASPWLADLHKKRNNRRGHAGNAWKQVLCILIQAMRDGWCDLDILLDLFFLHSPRRSDKVIWYPGVVSRMANLADPNLHCPEPTTLLEALDECNEADPWRNHYRDDPNSHPAHQITRLTDKFFGVHVADADE
ncbi:unnamed protein product [Phytophthora lilii]|uniref:Unnamed protein product n=1 Tax=Phytophthora lilii TaxID=2077276 RepID=A0A9W6WYI8_9STRA|nr:unnamed protein product [Phytophthora lilii]